MKLNRITSMKSLLFLLFVMLLPYTIYADTFTMPADLLEIEDEAFLGDSSLDEVIIPNGCEKINNMAFAYSSVRTIYIPTTVTYISDNAFAYMDVAICAPSESYALDYAAKHQLRWYDTDAIKCSEFCNMLTEVISSIDNEALSEWYRVAYKALKSNHPMTIERAMLSVYEAACALGAGDEHPYEWLDIEVNWNWELTYDYDEWPNWPEPSPFKATMSDINYIVSAFHFNIGRTSILVEFKCLIVIRMIFTHMLRAH